MRVLTGMAVGVEQALRAAQQITATVGQMPAWPPYPRRNRTSKGRRIANSSSTATTTMIH